MKIAEKGVFPLKTTKILRPALITAAVAVLFVSVYLILSAALKEPQPQPAMDITGPTQDGTLFSLLDNKGERGTLLIFFNHDTGKAINAMVQISEIAPEYKTVDIVAVATGKGTIEEQIAIMKENGITVFPHTLFDINGEMAKTYNVTGTPVLYFIDKNGMVTDDYLAVISDKSLRKELAAIA